MRKYGTALRAAAIAALALTFGSVGTARAADGGYLGVYLEDESVATKGAYVEEVAPDSPAEKANLRPTRRDDNGRIAWGDVILGIDENKVRSANDLLSLLADNYKVGQQVSVHIRRNGEEDPRTRAGCGPIRNPENE